jgi:uncharacterized protein (DUF1697 family)
MSVTRYVAFLRAVNVGKRRVDMARLREVFTELGFQDVSTFINSGNVIFSAPQKPAALEPKIERALEDAFGFEVITFVRTAASVRTLARDTTFDGEDGTHMVALLRARPSAGSKAAIEALSGGPDELRVKGADVHWLIRGSFLASALKPNALVKAAGGAPNTTRNMTMLVKLATKL